MKVCIRHDGFVQLRSGRYWIRVVAVVWQKAWKEYGPALEWEFEVARGTRTGCCVRGKTNLTNSLGPACKFGRWWFALTGVRLKKGETVDTDSLIGKCCWAEIVVCRSDSGKPANHVELVPGDPPDTDEDS